MCITVDEMLAIHRWISRWQWEMYTRILSCTFIVVFLFFRICTTIKGIILFLFNAILHSHKLYMIGKTILQSGGPKCLTRFSTKKKRQMPIYGLESLVAYLFLRYCGCQQIILFTLDRLVLRLCTKTSSFAYATPQETQKKKNWKHIVKIFKEFPSTLSERFHSLPVLLHQAHFVYNIYYTTLDLRNSDS